MATGCAIGLPGNHLPVTGTGPVPGKDFRSLSGPGPAAPRDGTARFHERRHFR